MKKIYCDICGALIPVGEQAEPGAVAVVENDGVRTATYGPPFPAYNACQSVQDLCQACSEAGKGIDVESMVLKEWKRITGAGRRQRRRTHQQGSAQESAPEPAEQPPKQEEKERQSAPHASNRRSPSISADNGPSGPGSHWARKKLVHGQLMEYRKRTGLGKLPALAQKANVSCETLRMMIEAKPVPIEEWRKVGAALDAMGIHSSAAESDSGD